MAIAAPNGSLIIALLAAGTVVATSATGTTGASPGTSFLAGPAQLLKII